MFIRVYHYVIFTSQQFYLILSKNTVLLLLPMLIMEIRLITLGQNEFLLMIQDIVRILSMVVIGLTYYVTDLNLHRGAIGRNLQDAIGIC